MMPEIKLLLPRPRKKLLKVITTLSGKPTGVSDAPEASVTTSMSSLV